MLKREMPRVIRTGKDDGSSEIAPCIRRWGPRRLKVARRSLAVLAFMITLIIFLGCMSFNIGTTVVEPAAGEVLVQTGKLQPTGETEQDVFYPIPYASPPNLTIDDTFASDVVIVDQQPDHFRVRFVKNKPLVRVFGVEWTAKGLRAAATKPPESMTAPGQQ